MTLLSLQLIPLWNLACCFAQSDTQIRNSNSNGSATWRHCQERPTQHSLLKRRGLTIAPPPMALRMQQVLKWNSVSIHSCFFQFPNYTYVNRPDYLITIGAGVNGKFYFHWQLLGIPNLKAKEKKYCFTLEEKFADFPVSIFCNPASKHPFTEYFAVLQKAQSIELFQFHLFLRVFSRLFPLQIIQRWLLNRFKTIYRLIQRVFVRFQIQWTDRTATAEQPFSMHAKTVTLHL